MAVFIDIDTIIPIDEIVSKGGEIERNSNHTNGNAAGHHRQAERPSGMLPDPGFRSSFLPEESFTHT